MQGFGSVLQIYYYQHMGGVMIIKFFNHSFHARQNGCSKQTQNWSLPQTMGTETTVPVK